MTLFRVILILLFCLGSAGCLVENNTSAPEVIKQLSATPNSIEIQVTPTDQRPTEVISGSIGLSTTENIETYQIPNPVPDPLRFVFPTPRAVPASAWRPPLHPIPWAPTEFDHFYFSRPVAADEINWPLPDYRYGGVFLPDVVHTGIDIPAPIGTEVLATGSGRVTWAGYGLFRGVKDIDDPYGLAIVIKHDFGYKAQELFTVYGHLDQINVVVGQHIEDGELIGLVGQTGKVTGPHLHYEVRIGKNNFFDTRNPELWLAPPIGWGLIAGRVMSTSGDLIESYLIKVRSMDTTQTWNVNTYGQGAATSDDYYRENVILGDLPAGRYEIWIAYQGSTYNQEIDVSSGMISYFTFRGKNGYKTELPPTPGLEFVPPDATTTSTP